tara:strand:- start:1995 stop:2822 length:828 start_codon:yes stop_codon:yes gene_type:complete
MYGNLYLVSTPIGNLEDITFRAVKILGSVDVILAESVERANKLLSHYDIDAKVISFNKDNEKKKIRKVIDYLKDSKDVALVSDAGTPSISDPGFYLLSNLDMKIKIIPIPGVSSLTCALSVSKIPMNGFTFLGFLPKKENDRKKKLLQASKTELPLCLFESKHRLLELLEEISSIFGEDTVVGLFREMTKIYETITHKSVSEHILDIKTNVPKGEFVVIVAPNQHVETEKPYISIIKSLILKNFSNKDIVDLIKQISSDSKKEIYKIVLSIRQDE